MNRKFYLVISLVVHSWNLYSPTISNLYTSSKVIVCLQMNSIPHISNWRILCPPNGPTDALLFWESVVGWYCLIFFLHISFLLFLPLLFSPLISIRICSIKITRRLKDCSEGIFNLFSVKNMWETLKHVFHRSDQTLVVSAHDSTR